MIHEKIYGMMYEMVMLNTLNSNMLFNGNSITECLINADVELLKVLCQVIRLPYHVPFESLCRWW